MELTFDAVASRSSGPSGRRHSGGPGPGWRAWYLGHGGEPRPGASAERQLRRHMPELVPIWQRQVELAGGDELAARFLTFWNPPAYLVHCSQAVLLGHDGPLLVRNYDLDPGAQRGHGAVQRLDRPAGDRDHGGHRRCGRRRQRGRARGVAGVRRAQGGGPGLRRAADRALPAGGVRARPRRRSRCCAACRRTCPTTSPWSTGRRASPPCSWRRTGRWR